MSDLNISVTLKLLSSVEFRDCCLVSMPATNYCDTLSLYYWLVSMQECSFL